MSERMETCYETQFELALDLGTTTGWALRGVLSGSLLSGTWNFQPRRGDGAGVRFLRLQAKLDEMRRDWPLRRVVYELPAGHYKSGAADDCIKGLVSHVQSWCERNSVPCEGYSPTQVKKLATGKGNANKAAVLAAAKEKYPDQNIVDGNQADALFVLELSK